MHDINGLIDFLKEVASENCSSDNLDEGEFLDIQDICGGNFDDAYWTGCDDGKIEFARDILALIKGDGNV